MTNGDMARSHVARAQRVLREAERLHGEEAWNLVVRRCQEAVELALKGALRAVGAEVPKVHDVSGALRRNVSPVILEKDFWVCWLLGIVFESEFADSLVFKPEPCCPRCSE